MLMTMRVTAAIAALVLAPTIALAQTADPREQLRAAISGALRPLLGDSGAPIVEKLMKIKPDGAISRGFEPGRVSTALFGRNAINVAPDCKSTSTPVKEPDSGKCVIESGLRESPTGAYTMLSYSKTPGLGDIAFLRRASFNPNSTTLPIPVKLSDADAYKQALAFLALLGVPKSEIPVPPPGAKNLLPVRSLVAGSESDRGVDSTRTEIHKVVSIQRGFEVPGGLFTDPSTGIVLTHVLAPGEAVVALNDSGVQVGLVEGWSDAQMDPRLDPSKAKPINELIDEITDDLFAEGVRKTGTLSILISLRKAYPNPDDPNPPLCPACGLLRPALKVVVTQPGINPVESSEKNWIAPGVVREYDLVSPSDAERPAR